MVVDVEKCKDTSGLCKFYIISENLKRNIHSWSGFCFWGSIFG